jgi:hypothetical protein
MVASILVREQLPRDGTPDSELLVTEEEKIWAGYGRD